jgi:hypothetical protein
MNSDGFASASVDASNLGERFELTMARAERPTTLDDVVRDRIVQSRTLGEAARSLLGLLMGGYSVWHDGKLLSTRVLVGRIGQLRIVIHTREHGPPHFHVTGPGVDGAFAITDCEHLTGDIGRRELGLIKHWHASARRLLVEVWNESRPSDCPVGPLTEGV